VKSDKRYREGYQTVASCPHSGQSRQVDIWALYEYLLQQGMRVAKVGMFL